MNTTKTNNANASGHQEWTDLLPLLLNGTLGEKESLRVVEHLDECTRCARELEELRSLQRGLQSLEPDFLVSLAKPDLEDGEGREELNRALPENTHSGFRPFSKLLEGLAGSWQWIVRQKGMALSLAVLGTVCFFSGFFFERAVSQDRSLGWTPVSSMPLRHKLTNSTRGEEFAVELGRGELFLRLGFDANPIDPESKTGEYFEKFRCELIRDGRELESVEGFAVREAEVDFVAQHLESGKYTLIYYGISRNQTEKKIDEFTINLTIKNSMERRSVK